MDLKKASAFELLEIKGKAWIVLERYRIVWKHILTLQNISSRASSSTSVPVIVLIV
jgi:hypothetical protein